MYYYEGISAEQQLNDIACYFATKQTWQIDFADADTGDNIIFLIEQKWRNEHGDTFKESFPYMDKLWNILWGWNVEETRTISEREEIIKPAKLHFKQKS